MSKRIALLCGSSLGDLREFLELLLLEQGIDPTFFEGDYNRYYEEACFSQELAAFKPDIIYFHTTWHNVENRPEYTDSIEKAEEKFQQETKRLRHMWRTCQKNTGAVIIQNNFDRPDIRPMGHADFTNEKSLTRFAARLNEDMALFAQSERGFYVHDIDYLSAKIGLSNWYWPKYMLLYKLAVSPDALPELAKSVAGLITSILGQRKKVLVTDLDNTLWGGIVGDDGADGIVIGQDTPKGEAFCAYQTYLKQLAQTGVLLCVASKNEEQAAISGFSAKGMVLTLSDFASVKANWNPKPDNIRQIARELNLGLDSFVFVDDNPAEREIVRTMLPEVTVIEADKPEQFVEALNSGGYFELAALSEEDTKRGELYRQNARRESEKDSFSDYTDYLLSLDMKGYFSGVNEKNAERLAQMAGKTNQFNLTTLRLSQGEILSYNQPDRLGLCARLTDKFGDNGIVTLLLGSCSEDTLTIDLWLMSCRVFSRHLEWAVFDRLVAYCKGNNIQTITGRYIKTAKNQPVTNLYESLGFVHMSGPTEDSIRRFDATQPYENKNKVIEIFEE